MGWHERIHHAVLMNDLQLLKEGIKWLKPSDDAAAADDEKKKKKVDGVVNMSNMNHMIDLAIGLGHTEAADILLECCCAYDVNFVATQCEIHPCQLPMQSGDIVTVQWAINKQEKLPNFVTSMLGTAIARGHMHIAELILPYCPDFDATFEEAQTKTPAHHAIIRDSKATIDWLVRHKMLHVLNARDGRDTIPKKDKEQVPTGLTPLDLAIANGRANICESLRAGGAKVCIDNYIGSSMMGPIYQTICGGHVDTVRWLIEHPDDVVDHETLRRPIIAHGGETLLDVAMRVGHVDIATMLHTEVGVMPGHRSGSACHDLDQSPLHHCVREGKTHMVKWILDHKLVDAATCGNMRNRFNGETPLSLAAIKCPEIHAMLLQFCRDSSSFSTTTTTTTMTTTGAAADEVEEEEKDGCVCMDTTA